MQGQLGDCYLISSISALCEQRAYVERLFGGGGEREWQLSRSVGAYGVWLCQNGIWRRIIVDDLLPTAGGHTVFAAVRA